MRDLIERQAEIDAFDTQTWGLLNAPISKAIRKAAQETIKQLPPAQPEIIHCKDCIYYRQEIDMCDEPYSTAHNVVHEDDYCSRAERRTE